MTDFTTLSDQADYFDQNALLERLTNGIASQERQVVFVVGAALTAPRGTDGRGVPGVDGVIEIIRSEFSDTQREDLTRTIAGSENRYQDAFHFLMGRRGPQAANQVIRKAVASARLETIAQSSGYELDFTTSEDACRAFESDVAGWALTPGVAALGELAVGYPNRFGRTTLTTNFDPLIGVAIAAAGGTSFRTFLHRDGNLGSTDGDGTHIVHLHGYWFGSDTLHTPRQLNQKRPQLQSSLAHLLRNRIVVVLAYGGWDDAFTQALIDVALDDNAYPEVIWCFRDQIPTMRTQLLELLQPGLDRGRIAFYGGVDCHEFLPKLNRVWHDLEPAVIPRRPLPLRPVTEDFKTDETEPSQSPDQIPARKPTRPGLINAEEDRPPVLDFYVGRSTDLTDIEAADCRISFITGMGGQGKSALAACHFDSSHSLDKFDHRLWRDCKEQSEKFEDHLIQIIEALNDGRVLSGELSKQPIEVLADLFCTLTEDIRLLVIFDNIDHYVDLETRVLTGAAGAFLTRFLANESQARMVFTCRPSIIAYDARVYTKRLEGLDLAATQELFQLRRTGVSDALVAQAHETTGGHAFWLDLLAAQVAARAPTVKLEDLLRNISSGTGEIPDTTLRSIWLSLRDREQMVLQALAESLRPVSKTQLADFLRTRVNFNNTNKAVRVLRGLNLLVIKKLDQDEEGFELHPVIRAFIYKTFPRSERVWYIDAILAFYSAFFGTHRAELKKRPAGATIRRWIEGAELCVNAGHYDQALNHLFEVQGAVRRYAWPGEFVRVVQYLLGYMSSAELRAHPYFDGVFERYLRSLVNLGRLDEASEALERFEETLDGKDVRYIHYCDMQAYMYWMTGDNVSAIKWASDGTNLKRDSGVEITFSPEHNLALAQRDSGAVDAALEYFLDGANIDDVLSPAICDADRGGSFYGNIGRCFHLMGQIDPALVCYAKSARLIETEHEDGDLENQAYVRQWVAELLTSKRENETALFFYAAALAKWDMVSPPKATRLRRHIDTELPSSTLPPAANAEKFVLKWISNSGSA